MNQARAPGRIVPPGHQVRQQGHGFDGPPVRTHHTHHFPSTPTHPIASPTPTAAPRLRRRSLASRAAATGQRGALRVDQFDWVERRVRERAIQSLVTVTEKAQPLGKVSVPLAELPLNVMIVETTPAPPQSVVKVHVDVSSLVQQPAIPPE
jgi:hypothetical protein